MIERKIVEDRITSFGIETYLRKELSDVPVQKIIFEKTPLGERITIYSSAPGLVIGREGSNIKKITQNLKDEFGFKNPQVKIGEVKNPEISAPIVAKTIANALNRFGSQRFKLTGFKALMAAMNAGAMGIEIRITGKIPSSRAKSWRFHKGYLKKTGYISDFVVDKAIESVTLKTGVVGIKVQIMLPDTPLPDKITYDETYKTVAESVGIPNDQVEDVVQEAISEHEAEKAEVKTEE